MDRALLESALARHLHWISAADAKIAPVLAVDTAILGSLAAFAPRGREWTIWLALLTSSTLTLLALSYLHLFAAGVPRTRGPARSLVFFGGVTERTEDEFVAELQNLEEGRYLDDLARQCYRNAEIAGEKHHHIRRATAGLLCALVPWALTLYFMYAMA